MTATAHQPRFTWAATHRALLLVLAIALVAVAVTVTVTVALLTRGATAGSPAAPQLPYTYDTCAGARVNSAC